MKKEEGIIPFEFKNGEYYSIEDNDEDVVGIFISNGNLTHYPNGDINGHIGYLFHAGLFAENRIFNPVTLAGPNIDGHRGFTFPKNFYVRYANDKEKRTLDKRLKSRGYEWDNEKKEIIKPVRKRKSK